MSIWKRALFSLCFTAVTITVLSYGPEWLEKHLGIARFASLLAISLLFILWAFTAHRQSEIRLATERANLEAKYEAQMARLIEDAAPLQK